VFAAELGSGRPHGKYEALLADPGVQAVYIAVPHPAHAEWAIKAAEAGKHVLCEKPLALNHAEAMAVIQAARDNDVFLMEAFMYRCHPQTARLVELLRSGTIGEVRHIEATFSFQVAYNPQSRLLANELGGGGILDVGCYCMSIARLIAGAAAGKDFQDPVSCTGAGHLGETGVDEYAVAVARFPGDIVATLAAGVLLGEENVVRVYGTKGSIFVPDPWVPSPEGGRTKIIVRRAGESAPEEIVVETTEWIYGREADTVALSLPARQALPPAMTWNDTLGNMRALDMWRESIGLVYESEKPKAGMRTASGRPLSVSKDAPMPHGTIPGLGKPVSRLIMGVDNQTRMPHASVMFDDFYSHGGTCFDTAHIYAGGDCERVLGQWVKNRGLRDTVVILDKGAHTPFCTPKDLSAQLAESLERLQTDFLDIYLMHRDNTDVPVGEFIDVLNAHKRKGDVRTFGVSNWTLPRVAEANAWARAHGLDGFSALSNNLSLARMVQPVWAGCIHVSDAASRAWLAREQLPLLSWSSQARGFFTDRADRARAPEPDLERCWYAEDNWARRERAIQLASRRGVSPIAIALAWVLHQPFPTFALIGPRTVEELRSSLGALAVRLTPQEVGWLYGDPA
jgi:aryl-alcohol dehydrogenase-like predicted oxidoreductase/predicted dehydrogenase